MTPAQNIFPKSGANPTFRWSVLNGVLRTPKDLRRTKMKTKIFGFPQSLGSRLGSLQKNWNAVERVPTELAFRP